MKRHLTRLLVVASLIAAPTVLGQNAPQADRYIITLHPGSAPLDIAAAHGLGPRHVFTHVLNGFASTVPPGRLAALANDPRVASVVVDQQVFAFGKPTKPPPTTSTEVLPAGVDRIAAPIAWLSGITGAGVGVAIVDTGLDFNHQDLPVSTAWSYTAYASAQDDNGHGTHVGGIVAAKDNEVGVIGVAHGATLYAVKVLDSSGSGYDSQIIAGLDAILKETATVTPPIKVVNMSLGRAASTPANDEPMRTAIKSLVENGITVVVAAGNDASKEISQMVPARFSEVIAVASTTAKVGTSNVRTIIGADTASFFTTDGAGVAISAPGEDQENIKYPRISSVGILSTALGGGTTRMSGTSMASPHAAGVVALLLRKEPTLTPDAIRARIMAGALEGQAPYPSPTSSYTPDGIKEGILYVPTALGL